jgi:protein-tyrosine phosphatase
MPPTACAPADHPDRVVALHGASNFRDLGGYCGEGGRAVRWRQLFRSDQLADLSDDDRQRLGALGLRMALDFRGDAERAAQAYALPGVDVRALAIEPQLVQRQISLVGLGVEQMVGLMEDLYRGLVHDHAGRFAEFFEAVLDSPGPLVFHCTAGKDRTGFAAAMLLLALGVSREDVMQDYLLTNRHFRPPEVLRSRVDPQVLRVLWQVQEGFLRTALQAVDAAPGGLEGYLTQRLRLTPVVRQRLRDRYLLA